MDQLTFMQNVLIWNSMRNDRRDTDTRCAGVVISYQRRGPRSFGFEKRATNLIQFTRCHPGADLTHHLPQSLRADTSNRLEVLNILFRISSHLLWPYDFFHPS